MDYSSEEEWESDAEDDRRAYNDSCEEYGGYDESNSQTYDESYQICDSSEGNNICDDYSSDESFDYDDISYGDECADYVEVGSLNPIKPTPVRSSLGKSLRRGHALTRDNKVFQTRMEVLSKVCATKIDKNVCHNLVSAYFVEKVGLYCVKHASP